MHTFYAHILGFCGFCAAVVAATPQIQGRYTHGIRNFELLVPHKCNADNTFASYMLPHYFTHDYRGGGGGGQRWTRKTATATDTAAVRYNLHFDGRDHYVNLWPNHGFVSPEVLAEYHYPRAEMTVTARRMRRISPAMCHYTGSVAGIDGSAAALSTCDGLSGYVKTDRGVYFIEPVDGHGANELGHHLHIVHNGNSDSNSDNEQDTAKERDCNDNHNHKSIRSPLSSPSPSSSSSSSSSWSGNYCGASNGGWQDGWQRAFDGHFEEKYQNHDNLKHDHDHDRDANVAYQSKLQLPQQLPRRAMRTSAADHSRQRQESMRRYLEVLVVADKMFLDFHRDKDYENYILTVMNMVSDYFHDASTGNQIDIVVVRIIYLDQKIMSIDLEVTRDANKTLAAFCKWQNQINPKDVDHPQHHDIAILLTRHDICMSAVTSPQSDGEMTNCGLMGLAYLASACTPTLSCSINEDKGILLGIVIAHELGHILGADHDDKNSSGCAAKADDRFNHLMAPYVNMATSIWSPCSRTYLTEFFENGLGNCLGDEPQETVYKTVPMPPGAVYDADYQCNLLYANSTHCNSDTIPICQELLCQVNPSHCISNGEAPADGTKCGTNKWCYKEECVAIGKRPDAIAGGWSVWDEWDPIRSPCSRTCGGGVQFVERHCNNPVPKAGGLYCLGERKRYKICNTQPCATNAVPYRAVQCANFDAVPRSGVLHKWRPFLGMANAEAKACVLYCINERNVYTKMLPRVRDGTPCRPGTHDICISGVCRRVGCDWTIDSTTVDDKCGMCNGNGSLCRLVNGTYTALGKFYTAVVTLPKGARNVKIVELASSENMIAMGDARAKHFYLNGDSREENSGEVIIDKSIALYQHPDPEREELFIVGPLSRNIVFYVVFFKRENVGYTYEYYVRESDRQRAEHAAGGKRIRKHGKNNPKRRVDGMRNDGNGTDNNNKDDEDDNDDDDDEDEDYENNEAAATTMASPHNKAHWEFVEWTKCSKRCDGGETRAEAVCIGSDGATGDQFCADTQRPDAKTRVCNREECAAKWHMGEWSVCTGCKHTAGVQTRRVWCARDASRWEDTNVLSVDKNCAQIDGVRPAVRQLCTGPCPDACGQRKSRTVHQLDHNAYRALYEKLNLPGQGFRDIITTTATDKDDEDEDEDEDEDDEDDVQHHVDESDTHSDDGNSRWNRVQNDFPPNYSRVYDFNLSRRNGRKPGAYRRDDGHKSKRAPSNACAQRPNETVIIADDIPREELVIYDYPIKSMAAAQNLSDEAFEKLGDKEINTIDVQNQKVYRGEEAASFLNGDMKKDVIECGKKNRVHNHPTSLNGINDTTDAGNVTEKGSRPTLSATVPVTQSAPGTPQQNTG